MSQVTFPRSSLPLTYRGQAKTESAQTHLSMRIAREYQPQTPTHSICDADIFRTGYASSLWKRPIPGNIRRGVDDTPEQFTGGGWKNLPRELVDEVLGYLLDDLDTLKACSLTCKFLFDATRPLIHRRLVCLGSIKVHSKLKRSLLGSRKRVPGVFEGLIGVLPHTRHLTFKPNYTNSHRLLIPGHLQEYIPHLHLITKLHTLTLDTFHVSPFIPVFNERFGTFANTLRHLNIQRARATARELMYIICQFPLLEDLTISCPAGQDDAHPGDGVPVVARSPPLQGKLTLMRTGSMKLSEGLAALPQGLNFRSLELYWAKHLSPIVAACSHTATSVSYLWSRGDTYGGELNPPTQMPNFDVTLGTIGTPLDLKQNAVLERFEIDISLTGTFPAHIWIYLTLRTITSPAFKEFIIWLPNEGIPWNQTPSISWGIVDTSLESLSKRNPDFRIVLRGGSHSSSYGAWCIHDRGPSFVVRCLPGVSSKSLVKFERVPRSESRFGKFGFL